MFTKVSVSNPTEKAYFSAGWGHPAAQEIFISLMRLTLNPPFLPPYNSRGENRIKSVDFGF